MDMKFRTLCFMDLEATGLQETRPKITELSLLTVSLEEFRRTKPRVVDCLTICINPKKLIDRFASEITDLDNFMLQEKSPFSAQTANLINAFLSLQEPPVCLLAHNGDKFDFPLIQAEFSSIKCKMDDSVHCADTLRAFHMLYEPQDELATPNGPTAIIPTGCPIPPEKQFPSTHRYITTTSVRRELFPNELIVKEQYVEPLHLTSSCPFTSLKSISEVNASNSSRCSMDTLSPRKTPATYLAFPLPIAQSTPESALNKRECLFQDSFIVDSSHSEHAMDMDYDYLELYDGLDDELVIASEEVEASLSLSSSSGDDTRVKNNILQSKKTVASSLPQLQNSPANISTPVRKMVKKRTSYSLQNLHKRLIGRDHDAHNASSDAYATMRIVHKEWPLIRPLINAIARPISDIQSW